MSNRALESGLPKELLTINARPCRSIAELILDMTFAYDFETYWAGIGQFWP
jgi:hypothetical protein